MRPLAEDTPIEVERIQVEIVRRMTPGEKLSQMVSLNRFLRTMVRTQIRKKYPGASEREIELRAASRWLSPDLMVRAFGWDPRIEGY